MGIACGDAAGGTGSGEFGVELGGCGVTSFDLDFAGLGPVRAVGASTHDVEVLRRQLGSEPRPTTDDDPLLVVEFVERPIRGPHVLVGLHEGAADDDRFYSTRSSMHGSWVSVPFGELGPGCTLLASTGTPHVLHLIAVLNLITATRGVLALHAAAFELQGRGVLVCGWSKAGKSELMLGAMAGGAHYIADEWAYVTDGRATGLPEPIRVWDWFLDDLPDVRASLDRSERMRLGALRLMQRSLAATGSMTGASRLHRAAALVERQRHVRIAPRDLYEPDRIAAGRRIDHVVLVESHSEQASTLEAIEAADLAERIVASLWAERQPLRDHYAMSRYAFPGSSDPLIERIETLEGPLLHGFLRGATCHRLAHPYPAPIGRMTELIEEMLS